MRDFVRVGNIYFDPLSVALIEVGSARTLFVWIEGAENHMIISDLISIHLFFKIMELEVPEEFK